MGDQRRSHTLISPSVGRPTMKYPRVDESFARLRRAGWSIGETGGANVWLVIGTNGENMIKAEGKSQAEACF
jgi:hypothetical protein